MVIVLIIRRLSNCLAAGVESRIGRNVGCIVTRAEGVAIQFFRSSKNAYPHIDRARRGVRGALETKSNYRAAGNEDASGRQSDEPEAGPDTNKGHTG